MARSLLRRRAKFEGRPWTLKQVQGDEEFNVLFRPKADLSRFVIPARAGASGFRKYIIALKTGA